MSNANKREFQLEHYRREGYPIEEEVAFYIVLDEDVRRLFVVEAHITLDEELDGLVVHRISIPIEPDVSDLNVPVKQMAKILISLAKENRIEPGKVVHQNLPKEYNIRLEEPYKISSCYYQWGYETEVNQWLLRYLKTDGTIARIITMIDSIRSDPASSMEKIVPDPREKSTGGVEDDIK